MLSLIFSVATAETAAVSTSAVLGYGILAIMIVAITLSSQRWLLWYVAGGIIYWLVVEGIHSGLMLWSSLSDWHSYVAAMGISWLPLFAWVLYRALRYDDVSPRMEQERAQAAARYVEHSPIYDDYQPRFR